MQSKERKKLPDVLSKEEEISSIIDATHNRKHKRQLSLIDAIKWDSNKTADQGCQYLFLVHQQIP